MSFSQELIRAGEGISRAVLRHPFVMGLGDGSLPADAFRFYMCQDYAFLIEYARVLALAVSKGGGLEVMGHFARLLDATLNEEMELHREYASRFGISRAELEAVELAPTARAYTRHLLEVAGSGSLSQVAVSLMPCQWGYAHIGSRLAVVGDTSDTNPYVDWIRTYASEEFQALARWLCGLIDRLGEDLGERSKRDHEAIYLISGRYEYLFWEMAFRQETWPI